MREKKTLPDAGWYKRSCRNPGIALFFSKFRGTSQSSQRIAAHSRRPPAAGVEVARVKRLA